MLSKIIQFVKTYQADIILVAGVILISLLSFAAGFIVAKKQQEKEPIKIESLQTMNPYEQNNGDPASFSMGPHDL